ncbi:hypothetical protein MTBBW1_1350005 [Desulfamplus magnetovallimortis]|uniref:Uncharacterized protein n=1 Tax=Desulfamplus magnetovallimortis TaxID=1246637 RepID=A0A1W1H7J2_9BACT|nr:hypothetical protein MTBBW1_1350005 [Desulfamplus magnetovallimortis]
MLSGCGSETLPRLEGIETDICRIVTYGDLRHVSETLPRLEGIETHYAFRYFPSSFGSETLPRLEGIETDANLYAIDFVTLRQKHCPD